MCSSADRVSFDFSGSSEVRIAKYGAWIEIAMSRSAANLPKAAQRFSFHGNPQ